jgi:hypothetical protein
MFPVLSRHLSFLFIFFSSFYFCPLLNFLLVHILFSLSYIQLHSFGLCIVDSWAGYITTRLALPLQHVIACDSQFSCNAYHSHNAFVASLLPFWGRISFTFWDKTQFRESVFSKRAFYYSAFFVGRDINFLRIRVLCWP